MNKSADNPARVRVLRSPARLVALSSVMCALLLVVQFVLSFVPGAELVTVLFLSFCVFFGWRAGMLTATAFSLLRCFLFGFYANVVVLYLVYFNAFALFFGTAGRRIGSRAAPVLIVLLAGGALVAALAPLPVGALALGRIRGMAWALFGVMCALLAAFVVLLLSGKRGEVLPFAVLAAFFTVLFTLLDDVLTPLFYSYTADAALAYFYTGFLAMLPQTVCAAVSVLLLYPVLARIFSRGAKSPPSNVGRTQKDMV